MQNVIRKLSWWSSTIGRKQMIGVTGLGLSGFVLVHMLGNMLIFAGPEKFNKYGYALTSNEFIYVAEVSLLVMFVAHLVFALYLSFMNMRARTTRYAVMAKGPKRTTWTQRSLWAQGLLIFVFVILHLITFKYGEHYEATYGSLTIRDLHRNVIEVFSQPIYVAWYCFSLVILGFHLSHGVGSAFQTLGVNHPRYNGPIKALSLAYALIVTAGFVSQPIYVYFFRGS